MRNQKGYVATQEMVIIRPSGLLGIRRASAAKAAADLYAAFAEPFGGAVRASIAGAFGSIILLAAGTPRTSLPGPPSSLQLLN